MQNGICIYSNIASVRKYYNKHVLKRSQKLFSSIYIKKKIKSSVLQENTNRSFLLIIY